MRSSRLGNLALVMPLALLAGFLVTFDPATAPDARANQAPPAKSALPADLDLVPRDAAGFIHVRATDVWKSELAGDIRQLVDRAGPEAWKVFERKSPIKPSIIDRITVVMLTPQTFSEPFPSVDPEAVSALVIVSAREPLDKLKLMEALGQREKIYRRNVYHFYEELWSGLVFVDDRTFVIGAEDSIVQFFDMSRNRAADGPLQPALLEAATGKHQVTVGLNPALLAKNENFAAPPPVEPLFQARCATITLGFEKEFRLDLRFDYQKEDQAKAGEKALREALDIARGGLAFPIQEVEKQLKKDPDKVDVSSLPENFGMLLGLGMLRELDLLLKEAVITRQGNAVSLPFRYKKIESANLFIVSLGAITYIGKSASSTFMKVGRAIGAGGEVKDPTEEHLKTLHQALEKYQAKNGQYPPAATLDADGRPVLSWRVALLPYLGDDAAALYREFKLDEPWDSLHNKRLIKRMPKALESPEFFQSWRYSNVKGKTHDQVFVGTGTAFEGKGIKKADVAGNAVLVAHVEAAVYWTKPADLKVVADQPLPKLFPEYGGRIRVLQASGKIETITNETDEKAIRAMIQRKGK